MNILLQCRETLEFVAGEGQWTADITKALDFGTGHKALAYCLGHKLRNMQVYYEFEEPVMNFALPVNNQPIVSTTAQSIRSTLADLKARKPKKNNHTNNKNKKKPNNH